MVIKISDEKIINNWLSKIYIPKSNSHKGQNGKLLIIGGSQLFHAACLWSAEVASHFVDLLHFSSTKENNEIFLTLKKIFRNGMIISQKDVFNYIKEDDVILVGPGMVRSENGILNFKFKISNLNELFSIKDEGMFTAYLTKYLIDNFPTKKFVFDAGALQMMDKDWLLKLKTPAIITPHQKEFEKLFNLFFQDKTTDGKAEIVKEMAKKFNTVILMKAVDDIISDGKEIIIVRGGNQGLTKGGSGDVLAGLAAALYTKNKALNAAVISSILLKKSGEALFLKKGYWYNTSDLIKVIPEVLSHSL